MHHSFVLREPLEFTPPFSPFHTCYRDPDMSRRSTDFHPHSNRQAIERVSSKDHTTSMSTDNRGSTLRTTDSSPSIPQKRARRDSSSSVHTVSTNVDRPKDRYTWPAGPPPATIQRTSSSLQRSSSTSGRNHSQTHLPLHRTPSNSPTTPTHIQRSSSNQPAPSLSRRLSKSSQHSPTKSRPRPILFYHRHEPHYGFTNFSNHGVKFEGRVYPTSEHLFQSLKVCTLSQGQLLTHLISPDLVRSPPSIIGRTYPHV